MRLVWIIVVAGACLAGALPIASAAPARFWISESKTNPGVPGAPAPTIDLASGKQRTLYIWAQPATTTGGAFRELESFTLDIATLDTFLEPESAPFIDFVNGTFKVENPIVVGMDKRFQNITDSDRDQAQGGPLLSTRLPSQIGPSPKGPDTIEGLQGVSPFATPNAVGIGHPSDLYRFPSGGSFAWRVGEFAIQSLQSTGTNHLFLQIGHHGMRHQGDPVPIPPASHPCNETDVCPAGTEVYFGNSNVLYNAHNTGHRKTSRPGETFDLRINAIPSRIGDYNGNGTIGPEDNATWEAAFGQTVAAPGEGADGNRDGAVNAADYVMWRKLTPGSGAAMPIDELAVNSASVIPEPSTSALGTSFLLLVLCEVRRKVRGPHRKRSLRRRLAVVTSK